MENKEDGTQNRLAGELSPYLLQHASNPVDWYPWCEEAFTKAREEDKPLLLSIGYSTCHWCHVMAKEVFSDPEAARAINKVFVSIKIDREERPDLDNLYMNVAQIMNGSGGWPLNVIMTPEKKPFFAATYIPKESQHGRLGILELSTRIEGLWKLKRAEIGRAAEEIVTTLKDMPELSGGGREPGKELLTEAYEELKSRFDDKNGGFSHAPKFPSAHNLSFLLRYHHQSNEENALSMVEKTLTAMRRGGIYDQLGGGFHRYSTDGGWRLPHFEKMLYDQATLAIAYTEACLATDKEEYKETASSILDYTLRELTDASGGFHSGEDADSKDSLGQSAEGNFYLWKENEIKDALSCNEALIAAEAFGIKEEGNFTDEATGLLTGKNVLSLSSPDDLKKKEFAGIREKLFKLREERPRPFKDDKVLTDWNGLMIAALAKAGRAFGEPKYIEGAKRATDFILKTMRDDQRRLLHCFRAGKAAVEAFADDYAFLTWGMIELYEASFDAKYLEKALSLTDTFISDFYDESSGGFFFTRRDAEDLLLRQKAVIDNALPSANSVAASNLVRLARMTGKSELEDKARETLSAFSSMIEGSPGAFSGSLQATGLMLNPSLEVVVAGKTGAADTLAMLGALQKIFLPNTVILFRPTDEEKPLITKLAPFTAEMKENGAATAYICKNFSCEEPTTGIEEMIGLIKGNKD